MENVLQLVLTLSVVVVAITVVVAVSHLSAIRKSLEELARQGRMPVQPARSEVASERAQTADEAPSQPQPIYRPVIVSPPPSPAPVQRARFVEVSEQAAPASRPAIVSPPQSVAPVEPTRFGEAREQVPLVEEIPEQAWPPREAADQTPPIFRPATVSPPPAPAEAGPSRMPTIIGIVVLVLAIAFLVFAVLYTK
jgi:hypothetical protein